MRLIKLLTCIVVAGASLPVGAQPPEIKKPFPITRFKGLDVGESNITGTTDIVAGLRSKSGLSNVAILLQPMFDTSRPDQLGEAAHIMWYGAAGERFTAMGPHAGLHDHFSIYTKADPSGSGDTALEKRLDIGFGVGDGDSSADVDWNAVREFTIKKDTGVPLVGIGTSVPEDQLHVYAGEQSCRVQFESDAAYSQLAIVADDGFDALLLFLEGTTSRWLINNDASLGNQFTIHDYAAPGPRLIFKPNGETVFNERGFDSDFRIEAIGEPNAFFINGSNGETSIGGDRVIGTGKQTTTLENGATSFVASTSFIVLTSDELRNTLKTITGSMAFAGNDITILFTDDGIGIADDNETFEPNTIVLSGCKFASAPYTTLELINDGTLWIETGRSCRTLTNW